MPISSQAFVRRNLLLLVVAFLAIAGIVVTSISIAVRTQAHADAVIDIRRLRSTLADLRSQLQDAETGQRGYLLTMEQGYLTPYEKAEAAMPQSLANLETYSAPYPTLKPLVAALKEVIAAKRSELQATVQLAQEGKTSEAIIRVRQDGGKALMDEARGLFAQIITEVDDRLGQTVMQQRGSADLLLWVLGIGSAVILVAVGSGAWTVVRYTQELSQARHEIEALNVGLEEKVRERTSDLGRANEEIQRFAYIVTHDLRAPLVNIMGFTSELESSLAPIQALVTRASEGQPDEVMIDEAKLAANEDLPEAISFIRSSTTKMDGLINAILKLSREGRRPLKPERIDLEGLLRTAADSVQHQIVDAGGEVAFDIRQGLIVSDRMALSQIFGNLIDNAIKYRNPSRPLKLTIRAMPAPAARVIIEIEDNGRGIAPQDHERVFELFRRSGSQDQAGEGIGLAHVRSAVRTMGGDITVQSTLGVGSTFRVVLPRDLEAHMRSNAA